jgi:mannose-6-phosphate isomerase-like protein (cupin superfamily)
MPLIARRTLLYSFGVASVTPLSGWRTAATSKVVVAKPEENRFSYGSAQQARLSPCKLTSEDTGGTLSIFELNVLPRTGTVRHVHHREDEWFYVLSGEFIFEAGEEKYSLSVGGSIWLPRDIPHIFANTTGAVGKLVALCQPGGFEKFLDELGNTPAGQMNEVRMKEVMAKYGMEYLGPPLLGSWRQQH